MTRTRFPAKAKPPRRARRAIPPPPRASVTIAACLRPLAQRFGPGLAEIEAHWNDIVGARIAGRCRPVGLTGRGKGGGTLRVAAPGPAAVLVEADSARILERVNDYCGRAVAKKLTIVRDRARVAKKKAPAPRRRAAPSPERVAALEAGLDHVADTALRKALSRLGRAVEARRADEERGAMNAEPD